MYEKHRVILCQDTLAKSIFRDTFRFMTSSSISSPTPEIPIVERSNRDTWRILWRAFGYLRPYRHLVIGTYATMIIIGGLSLIIPQFIRLIIDRGIRQQEISFLGWSVLALLGLTFIKGIFTYFQGRWTEVASQTVAYDLRNAIQNKLTVLPFSYHDRTETGQLLSRAIQDVERIRFLTGRAAFRIIDGAFLLVATAVVLFTMNTSLAFLVMLTMPLLVWRSLSFGRRFRPLSLAIQDQLAVLTTNLEQNLRGARVVKAFAQEDAEIGRFRQQNERWFALSALSSRLEGVNIPLMDLIANLGTVAVIGYGGWLVTQEALTLGELVAFTTYLGQLTTPVRRIGLVLPAIIMASASGERIFEILDQIPDVKDAPDAIALPKIKGYVEFEDVSFGYLKRHRVLQNISFAAEPGQVVALLGATGSGKSTIMNLLPRFYDPTRGRVLVDGHDLRQVKLASLRSQMGIVLQETTLFAATIGENIAFSQPDATEDEIIAAAKAAQAHDFINELPGGYETHVGERGVTLSGGQKQRIAIARALLANPAILILDDATASVDTQTERLIQTALGNLMNGRTTFVIAHRLSTVRRADLILVLDKGQIVARGTHDELLAQSSHYQEIYNKQLRPQEREVAKG
jgi:ABC-type multidrug transport system fused ATPase/permease subunit